MMSQSLAAVDFMLSRFRLYVLAPLLVLVVRAAKPRTPEVDGVLRGHYSGILCTTEQRILATIQV